MPSEDPRVAHVLETLAGPIAGWRAALGATLARAEALLAAAGADAATRTARVRSELGRFAEGRISPEGLAALLTRVRPALSGPGLAALARGAETLRRMLVQGESLFLIAVPEGGSLEAAVEAAFAELGRGFAIARLVELVQNGQYDLEPHRDLLETLPFRTWSRTERRAAPPLVISVAGADLHAAALAEFCDGAAKLVVVVRGGCAPAALVRLISPGTLVLQSCDAAGLAPLRGAEGPAVAALVPEQAARFCHDPSAGKESWQRLRDVVLPEPPRRALGGISAWQQAEDLRQLAALARTPFELPVSATQREPALGETEAVDRLAAWLLAETQPSSAP